MGKSMIGIGGLVISFYLAGCGDDKPSNVHEERDAEFTVILQDGQGTTSQIRPSAYRAGIRDPYRRRDQPGAVMVCTAGPQADCDVPPLSLCIPGGCDPCSLPGWQAEYETVRIRLTDFLTANPGLDLADIVAVRFQFGGDFGYESGRVAIDDVEVTSR